MTYEQEDAIIAQAKAIEVKAFQEAEAKWKATPDKDKTRPWPRCWNITCNRTLVCQGNGHHELHLSSCQGFDW